VGGPCVSGIWLAASFQPSAGWRQIRKRWKGQQFGFGMRSLSAPTCGQKPGRLAWRSELQATKQVVRGDFRVECGGSQAGLPKMGSQDQAR